VLGDQWLPLVVKLAVDRSINEANNMADFKQAGLPLFSLKGAIE